MSRKLADSQTADPVFAYTVRETATVAAQLPVLEIADATASRQISLRALLATATTMPHKPLMGTLLMVSGT